VADRFEKRVGQLSQRPRVIAWKIGFFRARFFPRSTFQARKPTQTPSKMALTYSDAMVPYFGLYALTMCWDPDM
jgi:hypothetical protein